MLEYRYLGKKQEIGHCSVIVQIQDGDGDPIERELKHIERHSPDGFQWGYGGSGPADLALSILTDLCQRLDFSDMSLPDKYYQAFKRKFIATAGDELNLTGKEIYDWLAEQEGEKT